MKTFMIRESAMRVGSFYIDFAGEYEISGISTFTGITENVIHHIYEDNEGDFDSVRNVYYFAKRGNAAEAVNTLRDKLRPEKAGRTISLSEEEIEYIRKALINEESNMIFTKGNIRDSIFEKLNG